MREQPELDPEQERESIAIPIVQAEYLIPSINSSVETQSTWFRNRSPTPDLATPRSDELVRASARAATKDRLLDFLREFNGQIIVDLGAGATENGYRIAMFANARGYIGVEPYHLDDLKAEFEYAEPGRSWGYIIKRYYKKELIPATLVKQDALGFLRLLPDSSVCIFAAGLDGFIIDNDAYCSEVEKEIARVLAYKGAFINYDSLFRLDQNLFNMENIQEGVINAPKYYLTKFTRKNPYVATF
ncbi:MAG: hypothetical protein G01um101433_395 [Parcubacteria group bacterium Gr01-1014_33]|nr:MAG: hypothetical protein G01um101433_395 [Parcubacteria group bacterium Gr01-1014_33]